MIKIHALRKAFGTRLVLDGISAEVSEGRIVSLIGASGSGKSTLLRCLNALESFDAGSIEVAGIRLEPGLARGPLELLRARVGLVFQDYQLFPHLNALDNVTLAPRVVGKLSAHAAEQVGHRWLERVGLADRADARPHELSGGQKQRVALARALAQGARVLLLDEPTSALDPEMRGEVHRVLRDVARGAPGEPSLTMMIVTHDFTLASEISDELWVLERGTLTERGEAKELLARRRRGATSTASARGDE